MSWSGAGPSFLGSNGALEIETLQEFREKTQGVNPQDVKLHGWVFQEVDFSEIELDEWNQYDISGAEFWGCKFPDGTTIDEVRLRRPSVVAQQPDHLPFKPFRGFMYNVDELQKYDQQIYEHYLENNDLQTKMYQTMHDYFIQDALYDYLEGKYVVVIMGGHGMSRMNDEYALVARLGWRLAQEGFVVATGGATGAMEAANLGAYMAEKSAEDLEEALSILRKCAAEFTEEKEYLNFEGPREIIRKFGFPTDGLSLGVPTWLYGHEPSNMFATWHAKMFQNALREDGLIAIGNCGIIYQPGSAGTRQEVFQAACRNHYADDGYEVPMVFFDSNFWQESKIHDSLVHNSKDRRFCELITLSDEIEHTIEVLAAFRESIDHHFTDSKVSEGNKPDLMRQKSSHFEKQKARKDRCAGFHIY